MSALFGLEYGRVKESKSVGHSSCKSSVVRLLCREAHSISVTKVNKLEIPCFNELRL